LCASIQRSVIVASFGGLDGLEAPAAPR